MSDVRAPRNPDLDWLRKQAKRRLAELKKSTPETKLAQAQFDLAKQYGFSSWRALKAHIDSLTLDGQLFEAAKKGEADKLAALLDAHPEKLHARTKPYEGTLLHLAAHNGHLAVVEMLLRRGLDVNTREKGDNTYAMHWAAAAGHLDVVRRLADAGGDVVGEGDDHGLIAAELLSAQRGSRPARVGLLDLVALLALGDWGTAERLLRDNPALLSSGSPGHGALHLMAKRNAVVAVRWLLDHGADPSARWTHWDADVTPLHLAVLQGHVEVVRVLLAAGADPSIRDTKHDSDALGWAEFFGNREIAAILKQHGAKQ